MLKMIKDWVMPERYAERMLLCEKALMERKDAYTSEGKHIKISALQKNCVMLRRFIILLVLGMYWVLYFMGMRNNSAFTITYFPIALLLFTAGNTYLFWFDSERNAK